MRTQNQVWLLILLLLDIWDCRIGPFILRPRSFRINNRGSSHGKVLWDLSQNVAPGDFATNIVLVVIMHLLQAQLMSFIWRVITNDGWTCRWSVIQMKWLKLFYKIIQTKEPRALYKVGFMQKFSIVLKRILPIKCMKKCWWTITDCNQVKYKRITTSISNGVLASLFCSLWCG
jgi:hypothetical protein